MKFILYILILAGVVICKSSIDENVSQVSDKLSREILHAGIRSIHNLPEHDKPIAINFIKTFSKKLQEISPAIIQSHYDSFVPNHSNSALEAQSLLFELQSKTLRSMNSQKQKRSMEFQFPIIKISTNFQSGATKALKKPTLLPHSHVARANGRINSFKKFEKVYDEDKAKSRAKYNRNAQSSISFLPLMISKPEIGTYSIDLSEDSYTDKSILKPEIKSHPIDIYERKSKRKSKRKSPSSQYGKKLKDRRKKNYVEIPKTRKASSKFPLDGIPFTISSPSLNHYIPEDDNSARSETIKEIGGKRYQEMQKNPDIQRKLSQDNFISFKAPPPSFKNYFYEYGNSVHSENWKDRGGKSYLGMHKNTVPSSGLSQDEPESSKSPLTSLKHYGNARKSFQSYEKYRNKLQNIIYGLTAAQKDQLSNAHSFSTEMKKNPDRLRKISQDDSASFKLPLPFLKHYGSVSEIHLQSSEEYHNTDQSIGSGRNVAQKNHFSSTMSSSESSVSSLGIESSDDENITSPVRRKLKDKYKQIKSSVKNLISKSVKERVNSDTELNQKFEMISKPIEISLEVLKSLWIVLFTIGATLLILLLNTKK